MYFFVFLLLFVYNGTISLVVLSLDCFGYKSRLQDHGSPLPLLSWTWFLDPSTLAIFHAMFSAHLSISNICAPQRMCELFIFPPPPSL